MLPNWLIKKIENKKVDDCFIQEQLYIEDSIPIQPIEKPIDKKEEVERGVYIIDLF